MHPRAQTKGQVALPKKLVLGQFEFLDCHSRASVLSGARRIPESGTLRAAATREGDRKQRAAGNAPPVLIAESDPLPTAEFEGRAGDAREVSIEFEHENVKPPHR